MDYVQLGRSDLRVSRIALGAWAYGGDAFGTVDQTEAIRVIHAAIDSGINLIDTARVYGNGASETIVGKAVQGRRDRVYIASKCWLGKVPIAQQVDESLQRMGLDCIDLYQVHYPPSDDTIAEKMHEMAEIQRAGKIRVIGLSNFWGRQLREALDAVRFESLQPPYSIFWREAEDDALGFCRQNDIAVLPYSPLAQGLLTGKYRKRDDIPDDVRGKNQMFRPGAFEKAVDVLGRMDKIAEHHSKSLAQVAINWLLSRPGVTSVIVGAKSQKQMQDNLGAADFSLEPDEVSKIAQCGLEVSAMMDYSTCMWGYMPKGNI